MIHCFAIVYRAASKNRATSNEEVNFKESKEDDVSELDEKVKEKDPARSRASSGPASPHVPTCFGGVLALDGRDGYKIWEVYAGHEVNSLVCEHDLNGDNVSDCLAAGRFGTFLAINSVDGSVLWTFAPVQSMNCTKKSLFKLSN